MSDRTLSFIDGPDNGFEAEEAEARVDLTKRVKQLASNIGCFIKRVRHITFNVKAEDSALWMLDWENALLDGYLSEEERESSEQAPLERSVVEGG